MSLCLVCLTFRLWISKEGQKYVHVHYICVSFQVGCVLILGCPGAAIVSFAFIL